MTDWNAWNLEQAEQGQNADRRELTLRVLEEIPRIGLPPDASLLDVGIGAGFTTSALHSWFEYLGLDISEDGVARAREASPGARLLAVDFLEWVAPPSFFDCVLCVDTIAYFADQALAVRKMADTLKPGGWLVLSTLNPFVYSRLRWVNERQEKRMGSWLGRSDLETLLARAGFDVRRSYTVAPAGDQGWLRALNARRVKALLGAGYVRALEDVGLGQFRIVVARKV